ncbi:Oxalate:formate antiporter [Amphibalanus amphitrite]|uniref:Oxalate:formate antiporter n=1 Tax=Amphibalanus amphitrite TaxID=1232801 RepID=A0A6A4W162_AMPAM|nr:oxalate:formate antiporter-like [Amphibalanus amphitrite]XP_043220242.1 oxalate:formate antiporter-like [Amphibalanus amphitrite]KAF0297410.1 Oxalate:formate antiporter [Amphibalanus amphitrite]
MDVGSRARRLWDGARRLPRGGVISVAAGFLVHLSLGIMYTYGNLTTYMTSYLHVRLGLSVDYGDTTWIGSVQGVAQGPGVLLGSVACQRFGPRLTILAGSVLSSVGMALTCLTIQTSFAATTLSYGLMCGFGVGLAYTTPMVMGHEWFPHNRGMVSGLVIGGYGLGSIILTSVQTSYLNPENVSTEDDGFFHDDALLDRVPSLFLIQGAICAALQLCGVLGVRRPPPGHGEKLSEETEVKGDAPGAQDAGESLPEKQDFTNGAEADDPKAWRKDLLTAQTLQLLLGFVMNAYSMTMINSFWKAFGQTFIKDDHFLAMVGMGSSVFNMLGRMVWGLVCDVWGYKPTMVLFSGLFGALLFTFPSTSLTTQGVFLVWLWCIFFCASGNYSVVLTGTAATFGPKHAGQIYGVIFLTAALCLPLVAYASEVVFEQLGFAELYLVAGGMVSVGLTATLTFKPRGHVRDEPLDIEPDSF